MSAILTAGALSAVLSWMSPISSPVTPLASSLKAGFLNSDTLDDSDQYNSCFGGRAVLCTQDV